MNKKSFQKTLCKPLFGRFSDSNYRIDISKWNNNAIPKSILGVQRAHKLVFISAPGYSTILTFEIVILIAFLPRFPLFSQLCYRQPKLLHWKSSHECSDVGRHLELLLCRDTRHYHMKSWLEQVHGQSSSQHQLHCYISAVCKQHQPRINV